MLESVLAILTGGATGLLGTILSGATAYFERRQRNRHEIELRRVDLAIARSEAAGVERVAAIEAESAETQAELGALAESHRAAAVRWSTGESGWLVFVDVVRGLMRPVLTLVSLAAAITIYWSLPFAPTGDEVASRVVDTVLYIATTTVLWWFGTRPKRASS